MAMLPEEGGMGIVLFCKPAGIQNLKRHPVRDPLPGILP